MIKFLEHNSSKYPPRTYENASADATIAFAFDFNTPGERLTYDAVKSQGKLYIAQAPLFSSNDLDVAVDEMNKRSVSTLNIAGNQLCTIVKHSFDGSQSKCDELVYDFLRLLFKRNLKTEITLIRSGGQSGFDEAGIKAAVRLGIPALCLCPKGWRFNDINGTNIYDEQRFKNRFSCSLML